MRGLRRTGSIKFPSGRVPIRGALPLRDGTRMRRLKSPQRTNFLSISKPVLGSVRPTLRDRHLPFGHTPNPGTPPRWVKSNVVCRGNSCVAFWQTAVAGPTAALLKSSAYAKTAYDAGESVLSSPLFPQKSWIALLPDLHSSRVSLSRRLGCPRKQT